MHRPGDDPKNLVMWRKLGPVAQSPSPTHSSHNRSVSALDGPNHHQPHITDFPGYKKKLQQYLLDYYSSSTLNTCDYQTLPLMAMRLMIDPKVTPTTHHTSLIHTSTPPLQDKVKADLDRDVILGEPVTWCHHMVISPRRTIDFQPLNTHATSETHYIQLHFHKSRSVPQESLMHGMGTSVPIHTIPHSSHLGVATDIMQPLG